MMEIRIPEEHDITKIKEDLAHLAKGHIELKAALEETTKMVVAARTELNTLQEQIENMPSGYRNSEDIKRLRTRVEEMEKSIRPAELSTFHRRICDLEIWSGNVRANKFATFKEMREADDYLARQAIKLEECCKNTVEGGKILENRVNALDSKVGEMHGYYDALRRMFKSL